jgi:hypothetical protein
MTHFATARTMLAQTYLRLMCGAKPASIKGRLQAIIDAGHGDQPLKDMKFRCAQCGSRRTVCNGGLKRSRGLMPER